MKANQFYGILFINIFLMFQFGVFCFGDTTNISIKIMSIEKINSDLYVHLSMTNKSSLNFKTIIGDSSYEYKLYDLDKDRELISKYQTIISGVSVGRFYNHSNYVSVINLSKEFDINKYTKYKLRFEKYFYKTDGSRPIIVAKSNWIVFKDGVLIDSGVEPQDVPQKAVGKPSETAVTHKTVTNTVSQTIQQAEKVEPVSTPVIQKPLVDNSITLFGRRYELWMVWVIGISLGLAALSIAVQVHRHFTGKK